MKKSMKRLAIILLTSISIFCNGQNHFTYNSTLVRKADADYKIVNKLPNCKIILRYWDTIGGDLSSVEFYYNNGETDMLSERGGVEHDEAKDADSYVMDSKMLSSGCRFTIYYKEVKKQNGTVVTKISLMVITFIESNFENSYLLFGGLSKI